MKVICIEGIDAVGKETVSKALVARLTKLGYRTERVAFPNYDGVFGKAIKEVLMGKCGNAPELNADLMAPLYTLDRLAYFKENIARLFQNVDFLILDRGFYSNFMYQASKLFLNKDNTVEFSVGLFNWICKHYEWEIVNSGLFRCQDITTFVLKLSDEDAQKQLKNRSEVDTNEADRTYLNKCKQFVSWAMSDKTKADAIKTANNIKQTDKSSNITDIMNAYFTNVYPIQVIHAEKEENIPQCANKAVDDICKKLGLFVSTSSTHYDSRSAYNKSKQNNKVEVKKLINSNYLEELVAVRCMLSDLYSSLRKFDYCRASLTNLYAVYKKSEKVPYRIWYNNLKLHYDISKAYRNMFSAKYPLEKGFPCDVRFVYIPSTNTFRIEELQEEKNGKN